MSTVVIRARAVGDGSRRFNVRYRRGGRYTPVENGGTFKTKREAEIRLRVIRDWLAAGRDPRAELARPLERSPTVADLHSEWLASRRRVVQGTLDGYRFRRSVIDDEFGDLPVDAVNVQHVIGWVGKLEASYKPGTVRLFVTQLRMVLDFHGGPNPARDRRVELPRVIRAEPDPPDAPEVEQLLAEVRADMRLPVAVMELAGLRVSEMLSLRPTDIDTDGAVIRVRREAAKGQRQGRAVPVPDLLTDALEDALPFHGSRSRVRDAMRAVSTINPHALRHRRATLWYQGGVGPVELARRLGHTKPSMSLDVYIHVKPLQEIDHDALAASVGGQGA